MNTLHVEVSEVMRTLCELHKRGLYDVTIESVSEKYKPTAHISIDAFKEIFPDIEPCDTTEVTYGDGKYHHKYNVFKAEYDGVVFTALDEVC